MPIGRSDVDHSSVKVFFSDVGYVQLIVLTRSVSVQLIVLTFQFLLPLSVCNDCVHRISWMVPETLPFLECENGLGMG